MKKLFYLLGSGILLFSFVNGQGGFQNVGGGGTQVISDNQNNSSTPNSNTNEYSTEQLNNANSDTTQTAGNEKCDPEKDIMLNISIPFVGRCIKKTTSADPASADPKNSTVGNVFPKLMGGMIRLVMTAIYIIGFLGILVGGFMIAASGADPSLKEKGKSLIIMIIGGLILLGASGVILNLINPNFFGTSS